MDEQFKSKAVNKPVFEKPEEVEEFSFDKLQALPAKPGIEPERLAEIHRSMEALVKQVEEAHPGYKFIFKKLRGLPFPQPSQPHDKDNP